MSEWLFACTKWWWPDCKSISGDFPVKLSVDLSLKSKYTHHHFKLAVELVKKEYETAGAELIGMTVAECEYCYRH